MNSGSVQKRISEAVRGGRLCKGGEGGFGCNFLRIRDRIGLTNAE